MRRSEATTFTYYDVLGVSPSATYDEVRGAYRQLARQTHPDRAAGSDELDPADAELLIRAVNEAWHVLGDPARRAGYDADLARLQEVGGGGTSSAVDDDWDDWDDDWQDRVADERQSAEHPASALVQLLPLLVLLGVLMLIFFFTAYARSG